MPDIELLRDIGNEGIAALHAGYELKNTRKQDCIQYGIYKDNYFIAPGKELRLQFIPERSIGFPG